MSAEVGSAHISIFPVMNGFRSAVSKEAGAAGKAGAGSFGKGFSGAGRKTGGLLGRELKSGFQSASSGMSSPGLKKLQSDVASASRAVSKARLSQQDSAGKVRVAEAQLAETMAKYPPESARVVAAQERLSAAQRRLEQAEEATASASARLTTSQDAVKTALSEVATASARAGGGLKSILQNFHSGFTDSKAAASAFTGVSGALGGLGRAVADVSGLSKLGATAKRTAGTVLSGFTGLGSKVAGGLGQTWMRSAGWIAGVGVKVGTALSPVGRVAALAGSRLAAPFMAVGSKVGGWMSPVTGAVGNVFAKLGPVAGTGLRGVVSAVGSGAAGMASRFAGGLRSMASSTRTKISEIASSIGSGIRGAATAATAALAAMAVGMLSMGREALAASDATDKFKGTLKFAGIGTKQIDALTKSAQTYADKTVYSLGDIQSVTAQLAANSVPNFDKLAEAAGNLNAVAGGNADTFKSVGMVLTQTAGQGKLTTENWNQLSDAIPGASGKLQQAMLANKAYTGNFRDAMAKGQITADEFNKALLQLGMTDVAKKAATSATTFEGAWGNLQASVVGGMQKAIGPLKPLITSAMNGAATAVTTLFNAITKITTKIGGFVSGMHGVGSVSSGALGAIAGLGSAFAALGAGGLAGVMSKIPILGQMFGGLAGPLKFLGGPVGVLAAGLLGLSATGGSVQAAMTSIAGGITQAAGMVPKLVSAVTAALPGLISGIMSALPQLLAGGAQIVKALVQGIVTALPVLVQGAVQIVGMLSRSMTMFLPLIIQGAVSLLNALVQGLTTAVPQLIQGALAIVTGLLNAIVLNLPLIIAGGMHLITALIQGIVAMVPMILTSAVTLVTGLLTGIVSMLPAIISGGMQLLVGLVNGILSALPTLTGASMTLISGLLQGILMNLPRILSAGIQLLMALVSGVIAVLPRLITTGIQMIGPLISGILRMLPQIIAAGIQLIIALAGGLVRAIPQLVAAIPQIVAAIFNGFKGVHWGELGSQIISGLVGGLRAGLGEIAAAASNLASTAKNTFKNILGIHSPSRVFKGYGANVVAGLVKGLDGNRSQVSASISRIVKKIQSTKGLRGKSGLVSWVQREGNALKSLAAQQDTMAARLKTARDKLAKLKESWSQEKSQVADHITGEMDLSSLVVKDSAGRVMSGGLTSGAIRTYVAGLASQARTFAAQAKKLVKAGWPSALVQQVAGYGLDTAIEVARALLSAPTSDAKAIKSSYSSFTSAAGSTGAALADQLYGAGLQAQRGLIKGLTAKSAALDKAASALASRVTSTVKKTLGIHSPSRVFDLEIGQQMGRGMAQGLDRSAPLAGQSAAGMAAGAVDQARAAMDRSRLAMTMLPSTATEAQPTPSQAGQQAPTLVQNNYGVDAAELAARNRAQWEHTMRTMAVQR